MDNEKKCSTRKTAITIVCCTIIGMLVAASACFIYFYRAVTNDINRFIETTQKIEQRYINSISIYDDYSTPELEQKLRTYLFPAHMETAQNYGLQPIDQESGIPDLVKAGKLVKIESSPKHLYFFYNVQSAYRCLARESACGLDLITGRFQRIINSKAQLPPVKIAISSMLRPLSYQNDLRIKNSNATISTTHSYGVSFDIFYDDYFVALPISETSSILSKKILALLRKRMGFLLGDALREQFRSILMETLIQLQDEGMLYAILEKRQKCYHVTILPKANCLNHVSRLE